MRRKACSTGFIVLFATLGVVGFIGTAAADNDEDSDSDGNNGRLAAQAEIEDLMSCYAYSFDAIARATDAVPQADLLSEANIDADANFAEGLARFSGCTTADWSIEVRLVDGTVLLPAGAIPPGPLPWVNLVNNVARGDGQINSQHLFGSFSSEAKKKKGEVTAYAVITTYFDGSGLQPEGSSTGTSTYSSDVVRKRGKWLLKKTTLIVN